MEAPDIASEPVPQKNIVAATTNEPPAETKTPDRPALPTSNGTLSAKSNKPKATPTLSGLGLVNGSQGTPTEKQPEVVAQAVVNTTVSFENLRIAWDEFAATRKNQIAEYQILRREFQFEYPVIMVTLTNSVEEPLLENFKRDFIQFLRDRLKNSELTIATSLQKAAGKKVVYTSKEKFEHLAEKNPKLWDLKDKLGLDWDI